MNDIKRLIKKNKEASIFALVIFSLIVFILIFRFFSDNQEGKALYGNRLEGLVKIKSSEMENAKKILSEKADEIEVRTQGRIIKISYKIKNEVTKEDAKNIGIKSLEAFTKEEKSYYDVQIIVTGSDKTYPIMGTHHHTSENMVWTKDR